MGRIKRIYILYFLFLFLFLLFFHTRGIIVHDEGYVLNSASKVLKGEIIYRDFHFSYTPISVFATVVSFIIFGESILSSRLLMLTISFLSSILLFKAIKDITHQEKYGYVTTLIYAVWGPAHINFSWPVMFVIGLTSVVFYFLVTYLKKPVGYIPFITGILVLLVFLAKQNFGIVLIPTFLAFLLYRKATLTHILYLIYGYLWGIIFTGVYFIATNSLSAFISDFYEFTIKKILIHNDLTTPFIYPDTFLKMLGRTTFYLLPFSLSIIALLLILYRRRYYLLFIPLTVLLYSIIGLRPTADYVHLVPLLALTGIPLSIIINQYPTGWVKFLGYLLAVFLIITGIYTSVYKGYYRWDIALINNTYYLSGKAKVFVNQRFYNEYLEMRNILNDYNNQYIYTNTYAPMLYFLLDKKNPTAYDFPEFTDSSIYQKTVIYSLIAKKVPVIFMTRIDVNNPIQKFVNHNYVLKENIGDYNVYIRKD